MIIYLAAGNKKYTKPGTYQDTLRAASGCDSTVVLHLTVNANPVITVRPSGTTADIGGDASFSVSATGTITGYQWQSSPDKITWNNETNEKTKKLGISNQWAPGIYRRELRGGSKAVGLREKINL